MWGEGASDLWGRLEREEDEREAELLEAIARACEAAFPLERMIRSSSRQPG